ncbi:zinc finger protein 391-like isoform X2 [Dunckerocampus dactyliophorus]|uniref:zinc finger protein 391-like isoform X2 n=1 Tax=Dunckerocampus dactyliophorus TaxID=161453 RepID=UPI002406C3DF|nr:zinc finger protein 391-like isoform X2 [Dunckerocampus dactyliophorus]
MNHCYAKMATSSQREGGRESAPPTPSTSSTEKKSQIVDKDVQQLTGHQGECPPELQSGSSTLKQEDPQPPHIKEETKELWTSQEGERLLTLEEADLTKLPLTVVSVKTEDREDKPPESLPWLCSSDVQQVIEGPQVGSCTLMQGDPQTPHIKEEKEELWTTQEGERLLGPEEADLTMLPMTGVSVKTEDHEDKPPESSQFHHSPSEENRRAEPPNRSSPQHMTTEADDDHCGGSQADKLLAPLSDSDDATSHSPEDEDRDDIQEPFSGDTDWEGDMSIDENRRSECSKKKTGKKCFICSICARRFSFKCHLTQHMRTHTGEKPFACSVCGKTFSDQSGVGRHMRTHTGEKPFSCSVCNKRLTRKSNMAAHMRTHTGEKPFACSVCGQRFPEHSGIVRHMRTHTGEKPFSCSVCDKRFSQKSTVVLHMRKHTGEQSFACSLCGQRFFYQSGMVSHMKTHTGEQPFSCSVCAKRFARKRDSVRHMSTHTGHKPFSCSVCGESYSCKKRLTTHMHRHTMENKHFTG